MVLWVKVVGLIGKSPIVEPLLLILRVEVGVLVLMFLLLLNNQVLFAVANSIITLNSSSLRKES